MKHLPRDKLDFCFIWKTFLEELSKINPNWKDIIGKPKKERGVKGEQLFKHIYYLYTRWIYRPDSSADENSPEGSPHKAVKRDSP